MSTGLLLQGESIYCDGAPRPFPRVLGTGALELKREEEGEIRLEEELYMAVRAIPDPDIESKVHLAQRLAEHVLVIAEMAMTDRERADRELEDLVVRNHEHAIAIRSAYRSYLSELGVVSTDVAG